MMLEYLIDSSYIVLQRNDRLLNSKRFDMNISVNCSIIYILYFLLSEEMTENRVVELSLIFFC